MAPSIPPEYEPLIALIPRCPLLEPAAVGRTFGLDRKRIYELIRLGELTALRVTPIRLRVTRESVVEWVARGGCAERRHGKGL